MEVIMIVRLYAMYEQSRKMLIFLVVIFLALTITIIVTAILGSRYIVGGKLPSCIRNLSLLGLSEEYRGARTFRHLRMQCD
jgi:hypothetical protein